MKPAPSTREEVERICGPMQMLLRKALFNVRADLTLHDLKPLESLIALAYRKGWQQGQRGAGKAPQPEECAGRWGGSRTAGMRYKRGTCPQCNGCFAIRRDGEMYTHECGAAA